jgi:flagellar hook-basal body complex protein FliE
MPISPIVPAGLAAGASSVQSAGEAFAEAFASLIDRAASLERAAESQASSLARGGGDVAQALLALQEASLGIEAMAAVRDRVVSAYQALINMPV